ncbi:MAG: hypothetical protein ABJN40_09665 [Sneathiella sp.]
MMSRSAGVYIDWKERLAVTDEDKDRDNADAQMPEPPDLSALYQEQSQKLKQAQSEASQAFGVLRERDQKVGALANMYQEEIVKVLAIAKAVSDPISAVASIPVVLAAANAAFAQASITEQATIAAIDASFSALKGGSD